MKVTSKDGRTWFQKNEDGSVAVGFTKEFLNGLDCCWHMMAASGRVEIKEDQPLLSVETNDGLFSVLSPTAGVISYFDNRALNFPDKLDDETVVAMMKPAKEAAQEEQERNLFEGNPFARPIDWDALANQPIRAQAQVIPGEWQVQEAPAAIDAIVPNRRLNIPRGGF